MRFGDVWGMFGAVKACRWSSRSFFFSSTCCPEGGREAFCHGTLPPGLRSLLSDDAGNGWQKRILASKVDGRNMFKPPRMLSEPMRADSSPPRMSENKLRLGPQYSIYDMQTAHMASPPCTSIGGVILEAV